MKSSKLRMLHEKLEEKHNGYAQKGPEYHVVLGLSTGELFILLPTFLPPDNYVLPSLNSSRYTMLGSDAVRKIQLTGFVVCITANIHATGII